MCLLDNTADKDKLEIVKCCATCVFSSGWFYNMRCLKRGDVSCYNICYDYVAEKSNVSEQTVLKDKKKRG